MTEYYFHFLKKLKRTYSIITQAKASTRLNLLVNIKELKAKITNKYLKLTFVTYFDYATKYVTYKKDLDT